MYKVPSSEITLSIFERYPRRIRWGICLLLILFLMYFVGVVFNVGFNTMEYRDADRYAWADYPGDEMEILILVLIWLGFMLLPLLHRYVIKKTWFLKAITFATLAFIGTILFTMPTHW